MLSFERVMKILVNHGINPAAQRGWENGKLVDSGTSFFDTFGIRDAYLVAEVYRWLGY